MKVENLRFLLLLDDGSHLYLVQQVDGKASSGEEAFNIKFNEETMTVRNAGRGRTSYSLRLRWSRCRCAKVTKVDGFYERAPIKESFV